MIRAATTTLQAMPLLAPALGLAIAIVIDRMTETAYIQFPFNTPMVNVIAAVREAEGQGVGFDLLDPDLWEEVDGGTRIHGMFVDSIYGEELVLSGAS